MQNPGSPSILFVLALAIALALSAGCVAPAKETAPATNPATTIPPTTLAPPVTVIIPVNTTETAPGTVYKTFTSSPYGFSIDYPDTWIVHDLNTPETNISATRYDVVEFTSPTFLRCNTEKTECVNLQAKVKVEADTKPSSTDLDTFFVKEVARVTSGSGIEITKRDAMFKLAGDKAYRLDYALDTDEVHMHALSAYTVRNGVAYIITYQAHDPARGETSNQFEQYYNDAMAMLVSFSPGTSQWKTY